MVKLARLLFLVGALTFIGIGAMHSFVHVTELSGAGLEGRFDQLGPVLLQGDEVRAWDLFQGLSLLMGAFSIALGLVLLGCWLGSRPRALPHPLVPLAVLAQLLVIMGVGWLYLSPFQVIGGAVGLALFAPALFLSIRQ